MECQCKERARGIGGNRSYSAVHIPTARTPACLIAAYLSRSVSGSSYHSWPIPPVTPVRVGNNASGQN